MIKNCKNMRVILRKFYSYEVLSNDYQEKGLKCKENNPIMMINKRAPYWILNSLQQSCVRFKF